MAEEHVFDLLPGYALGCLDEQDLLLVARHLPGCLLCREELAIYWETVDQLPLTIPLQSPAPDVRARILARVSVPQNQPIRQSEPVRSPALSRTVSRAGWLQWLLARPLTVAVTAAVVLLLAVLTVANLFLWQQVNRLQASQPGGPAQVVHMQGTGDAPQAVGYLVLFPSESYGSLVVEDAPPLPPGYEYQLWLIRDGKRTSGGVFSVGPDGYGTLEVRAGRPLDSFTSFGVTVEPAGGSPGPTGTKVLGGDL